MSRSDSAPQERSSFFSLRCLLAACPSNCVFSGVIRQPAFVLADALRKKTLVRVLPDWSAGEHGVFAVYPNRQYLPPKVRTFIDFLAERFGQESDWTS